MSTVHTKLGANVLLKEVIQNIKLWQFLECKRRWTVLVALFHVVALKLSSMFEKQSEIQAIIHRSS